MSDIEQFFTDLKAKIHKVDDEELNKIYNNSLILASKFKAAGQVQALRKLVYVLDTIEVEHKLIANGIDRFVYKDDIDFYIDSQESKPIKIIELKNYEREIPDEIVEIVERVGSLFDELYVLYTDYTERAEKRIEADKRTKDPILFGVFMDTRTRTCVDRFYVLGDWVDPYCDLTLEKLVSELANDKRFARTIYSPSNIESLKNYLEQHKQGSLINSSPNEYINFSSGPILIKEQSWFSKVKSWFK